MASHWRAKDADTIEIMARYRTGSTHRAGECLLRKEIRMDPVTTVQKVTPVLVVEKIEPVVGFWKKLAVPPSTEVPSSAGDGLVFAIFSAAGVQIMYQTAASVREDLVGAATVKEAFRPGSQQSTLYIEVGNLAEVERRLQAEQLVMPRRTTFYGATEVAYADPAGNIIVFAQRDTNAA
jgi:predicted enzyme related to lactoylglutathione lyase